MRAQKAFLARRLNQTQFRRDWQIIMATLTKLHFHYAWFAIRIGFALLGIYLTVANSRPTARNLPPLGLAISPNQNVVAAVFEGGPITILDLKNGSQATELGFQYHQENWRLDHGQSGVGPRCAFLDDDRLLIVSTEHLDPSRRTRKLTLAEWEISTNQQLSEEQFEHVAAWAICGPSALIAIQCYPPDAPSSLKVWDIRRKQYRVEVKPTLFLDARLAIANDGSRLVAFNREAAHTYDLKQPDSEPERWVAERGIYAVDANAGNKLVTRWDRQPNRFPNAETPNFGLVTDGSTFPLTNSADEPKKWSQFTGNGKYVASALGQGVGVWATMDGRQLGIYECPHRQVISLAGSDTGDRIVIGRFGVLVVWDILSGKTSEILVHEAARTFFQRFGGWLAAVIFLAVALGPHLNLRTSKKPGPMSSWSGMILRLCVVLYASSLAAPALEFTELDGSTTIVRGYQALTIGWIAVPMGQLAWLANPCIAIGLLAAMRKAWTVAFAFGALATLLALNTLTLFLHALPGIDAPETGGQLSELSVGFFLWLSAVVSFCAFAAMNLTSVRSLPRPFRERRNQRADWQELLSDAEMDSVDALLRLLCDAFSFSQDERYRFAPTDTIAEIYRACYPRWKFWIIGDNLEIESLMAELERKFHIDDSQRLADISLGEIAAMMQPP